MIEAVLLVGGLGTRLRTLGLDRPKPMLPVAGKPFMEYLLLQLRRHGFRDLILCVGYQGDRIHEHFREGHELGLRLRYSYEKELLGTAGALKLAQRLIGSSDFLVMNGDSFFDVNLDALIQFHSRQQALATIALVAMDDAQRYGTVDVDETGKIVGFVEKHARENALVNGGIYVFRRDVLDMIPEGRELSLEREIFLKLVHAGFYGVSFNGYFIDIGVPEDYLKLQADPSELLAALG